MTDYIVVTVNKPNKIDAYIYPNFEEAWNAFKSMKADRIYLAEVINERPK